MWHAYFDSHIHTHIFCVLFTICVTYLLLTYEMHARHCTMLRIDAGSTESRNIFLFLCLFEKKIRVKRIYFCLVFELYGLWKLYNRWIVACFDKCSSWSHVWLTWTDNSTAQIQIVQRNNRKRYFVKCQHLVFFQFCLLNLLFDSMNKRIFFSNFLCNFKIYE